MVSKKRKTITCHLKWRAAKSWSYHFPRLHNKSQWMHPTQSWIWPDRIEMVDGKVEWGWAHNCINSIQRTNSGHWVTYACWPRSLPNRWRRWDFRALRRYTHHGSLTNKCIVPFCRALFETSDCKIIILIRHRIFRYLYAVNPSCMLCRYWRYLFNNKICCFCAVHAVCR